MKENLALFDRMVRVLICAIVVYLFYANVIVGYVAAFLLITTAFIAVTAFTSFCPIYKMLRISSLKKRDSK